MARVLQVGAGSGGIVVLDAIARDPRIHHIDLIEPDVYSSHNVHRHLYPVSAVGRMKAEVAVEWLRDRRPDLAVEAFQADITDPGWLRRFESLAEQCDVGVCAADNETAKFAFDSLMRNGGKPWTLGEVLSGGIGGWVHAFTPDGPCYGCVASHLQRNVAEEPAPLPPDYSNPAAEFPEARIPAGKAAIGAIANLHALLTLDLLGAGPLEFTSFLFTLARVPGIFDDAYRTIRFRIPKSESCLICLPVPAPVAGEELDAALDQALARLGRE